MRVDRVAEPQRCAGLGAICAVISRKGGRVTVALSRCDGGEEVDRISRRTILSCWRSSATIDQRGVTVDLGKLTRSRLPMLTTRLTPRLRISQHDGRSAALASKWVIASDTTVHTSED